MLCLVFTVECVLVFTDVSCVLSLNDKSFILIEFSV